jgi:hypothetical protein
VERRRAARFRVQGNAFWDTHRVEGRCRVLNISTRGVGIADPTPELRGGEELEVTLALEDQVFPAVQVRVVHAARGLGLAFVHPDAALIQRIEELTEDLTPLSWTWPLALTARRTP